MGADRGRFDSFADFVGSGGTYAGVTRALKERDPRVHCYVIEPEGAAAIACQEIIRPNHPIQGGGYAILRLAFFWRASRLTDVYKCRATMRDILLGDSPLKKEFLLASPLAQMLRLP
jgi:cysteine synthase